MKGAVGAERQAWSWGDPHTGCAPHPPTQPQRAEHGGQVLAFEVYRQPWVWDVMSQIHPGNPTRKHNYREGSRHSTKAQLEL